MIIVWIKNATIRLKYNFQKKKNRKIGIYVIIFARTNFIIDITLWRILRTKCNIDTPISILVTRLIIP